jgi:hypothetical protein
MRLSDFQKPQTQQRNLAAEALCDANAKKILGGQVDWQGTAIRATDLASGVNDPFRQASHQILHDALDEAIDHGAFSGSDEEPEERYEDEEVEEVVKPPKSRTAKRSSYGADTAFVAEYIEPNKLCVDAAQELRDRVYREQAANPRREFWSGLFYFLNNQKQGVRIRDVDNKACLSMLISKTLAA